MNPFIAAGSTGGIGLARVTSHWPIELKLNIGELMGRIEGHVEAVGGNNHPFLRWLLVIRIVVVEFLSCEARNPWDKGVQSTKKMIEGPIF
jgi:hypothetical protein